MVDIDKIRGIEKEKNEKLNDLEKQIQQINENLNYLIAEIKQLKAVKPPSAPQVAPQISDKQIQTIVESVSKKIIVPEVPEAPKKAKKTDDTNDTNDTDDIIKEIQYYFLFATLIIGLCLLPLYYSTYSTRSYVKEVKEGIYTDDNSQIGGDPSHSAIPYSQSYEKNKEERKAREEKEIAEQFRKPLDTSN